MTLWSASVFGKSLSLNMLNTGDFVVRRDTASTETGSHVGRHKQPGDGGATSALIGQFKLP